MSLDVCLLGPTRQVECTCPDCDNKHTRPERDTYFDYNITHNLGKMAERAGIYKYLWRPDELGITQAHELIEPLKAGLKVLTSDPETFKKLNPPNGWGNFYNLVSFIEIYLHACEQYPSAQIGVSR